MQFILQAVSGKILLQKIMKHKGNEYRITISIGVAEYKNEMSEEDIISIADKALYKAKLEGRNKVIPYYV